MRRLTGLEEVEIREQIEEMCQRYALVIANESDDHADGAREFALSQLRVASLLEMFTKAHVSEAVFVARKTRATTADIARVTGVSKQAGWKRWKDAAVRPRVQHLGDDRDYW